MCTYSKEITDKFFELLNDEISLDDFEKWILYDVELEKVFGTKIYSELLSFKYSLWETKYELKNYILSLYRNSRLGLQKEKVLWIIKGIINGSIESIGGCSELAILRPIKKEYEYIPIEFVGIQSMIEDLIYDFKDSYEDKKNEKQKILKLYNDEIVDLAKKMYAEMTDTVS